MVTWERIEAECDGYREGFVAVYRKYEGESTDEKDRQGRTVKVTVKSFARHSGIPESTFGGWARKSKRATGVRANEGPGTSRTGQILRQTVKSPVVSTEDKVGALGDLLSDPKVLKAYRERRTPKVTPEQVKHAEAVVDAFTAPLMESAGHLMIPMWIDHLNDIADGLGDLDLGGEDFRKIEKALKRVNDELEVQKFRLGLEV